MRVNLKLLRVQHDLTQDQMAERLGVTRTTYNLIENGKSKGSVGFWLTLKREFPEADITEMTKQKGTEA